MSYQWKVVPRKPACMLSAKCLTGKILAVQVIQVGALSPIGMKIPDRSSSGRIVALTIGAPRRSTGWPR